MSGAGAPTGNTNATKNRPWSDAIRKEVLSRKRLAKLAKALVDKAEQGDMQAMKEMGDRMEGKVAQVVEGSGPQGEILAKVTVEFVGKAP